VAKRKRQSVRPQSPPAERWTIDQAFQRLLQHFKKPHLARHELGEAIRAGKVQLWGSQSGGLPFRVKPDWFERHLLVTSHERPEGWYAVLEMERAVDNFDTTVWEVAAKEIEALCENESLPGAKRGRKRKYDWELFKARFFLLLYGDKLPADTDINQESYADELIVWGQNHPMVREENTPAISSMREKVAEWTRLWPRLRAYDEREKRALKKRALNK
jgi:hypothetical protein